MTVFSALYANEYDTLYATKNYGGECDLVESAMAKFGTTPVRSLLDIGCGTGGHAIEMARRGYSVSGVDLSSSMIEVAEAKAAAALDQESRPRFQCGDARSFDLAGEFDAAIMMFAVISYLTSNEDVLRGLRNIRKHLKPGALFICDFWYGPAVLSVRPSDRIRVLEHDKGKIIRAATTEIDSLHQTADVQFKLWSLTQDQLESETTETHRMRYFFPQEFKLMLEMAGFSSLSLSQFPQTELDLTDQSWNAFCVAAAI